MAFQKVRVLEADTTISLGQLNKKTNKTDPKSIEGYYLGFKTIDGDFGEAKLHHFETSSGVVAVWGKSKLDSGLSQVKIGNMTRVEFTGLGKPSKGRQPARLFSVEQDPDNTIEVLPFSNVVETVEQDSGDESTEDSPNYEAEEDVDDQDVSYQANKAVANQAALAAAERKAAVFAQLKAKGLKK